MECEKQKVLIQNSFLIWLNSVVLVLTAIPTHHYFTGTWSIPKNYENIAYALSMIFCAFITIFNASLIKISPQQLTRYKFYMLVYMPLAVALYSFITPEGSKFIAIFAMSFLGFCILAYDIMRPKIHEIRLFNKSFDYHQALIISVAISVFLILWRSQGNSFNLINWKIIVLISLNFIFLHYIRIQSSYWFWLIPVLIFAVTFFTMENVIDYGNASFIAGPAVEYLYSHHHPLTINAQYGSGLTLFIAWYYKLIGVFYLDGLLYLLKITMFFQYLLVYWIALKFSRSHKIAFLSLVSVLIFNFYSVKTIYYYFPQIGFIRFGLIYLIIFCYLLEDVLSPKILSFLVSVIASVAAIWSFESAVYVIPAVLFTQYITKNLRQFLPVFLSCFVTILFIYILPLIQQGQLHALARYYEYASLYAVDSENFFAVPIPRLTNLWWLYVALYAFILIQILSGKIKDKIVILLTVYGIATFTYFGGRAHPANLCVISIPFILLSVYTIIHLSLSSEKKTSLSLAVV